MSILTRFGDIVSANINAILDKMEDPSKMIDQYLRNLMNDLAEVKKETANIMAEETRAKRVLDNNTQEIVKYTELTKKALVAGNEDDAKVFVAKKQELEKVRVSLEETYNVAHNNAVKMREMHDKLTKDINELNIRKDAINAKVSVAKTQDKINKIGTSVNKANATTSAFERMEEKANKMLDSANAMAELNSGTGDATKDIEAKYSSTSTESVNAELEKMKSELGL